MKLKSQYKKLLKIKKPVLIEVGYEHTSGISRFRILYPNGKCEYSKSSPFAVSCFRNYSLKKTVEAMQSYDDNYFRITKIKEI